jgi:flagella basal body P-ring formation protein FlgA
VNGTFIYVPVTIESKSGKLKSLLTLRMKLRKMALVAIHEIQVNTDLQVSDFVQQEVDATGLRGSLITDYTELTRLKSKMHIKSGSYLTDQMIRRRSLIKHGDPILCYVSNSSVVVSLDCIARDDGNPGEIIHVMSRDKHVYRAKIETEQTARIIE